MCVIVYKPAGQPMPGISTLAACWAANRDGAGFMRPEKGSVRIRKGFMEWNAFVEALDAEVAACDCEALPFAMHFRIATHGAVKPGCCHPFPVCGSASQMRVTQQDAAIGFMHNGVLSGLRTSDAVSDSMAFVKNVLSPLDRLSGDLLGDADMRKVIGSSAQGSRFLLMDGTGDVRTFGRWMSENGIMFSNDNWIRPQPFPQWAPGASDRGDQLRLFDAFRAFAGDGAVDPARLGLYPACAGCELMPECAEWLPYCADAEDAEAMAAAVWQPCR